MLLSTKPNRFAGWGRRGQVGPGNGDTVAVPQGLARVGEFQSMRLLQPIVNSLSGLAINCLSFCNMAPSTAEIPRLHRGANGGLVSSSAIETIAPDAARLRSSRAQPR